MKQVASNFQLLLLEQAEDHLRWLTYSQGELLVDLYKRWT